MLSRLHGDPLFAHERQVPTTAKLNNPSWFARIRSLCLLSGLPHPLVFLDTPLSKVQEPGQIQVYVLLGTKLLDMARYKVEIGEKFVF